MRGAKADGVNLVVCSPYRDYNRQTVLFNRKIDYYMEKGYSYLESYKLASVTVTVPGASEHQIGLSLDIVSTTYSALEIGFGDTKAGQWLKEHCAEYGFILRYPLGKEDITGIQYEPWHFRYVGKTAAAQIMERGITLEEFVAELD
jgi:D-alanyl-D-alanine carboxypeptidase